MYERVQAQTPKIRTGWVRDQVIAITPISAIREQWTGLMDEENMRGFYIEGPLGPPTPLSEKECLIVLNRNLSKPWRRMVLTKELMHAFDLDDEKTDSAEKLDHQAERFRDPTKAVSPQYTAEGKAFWRALAVLCPETFRLELLNNVDKGSMTESIVAARLAIPERYVRVLFRNDFREIIDELK